MSHVRKKLLVDGTAVWQARASSYASGKRRYISRQFRSEREAVEWARAQGAFENRGTGGSKDSAAAFFRRWIGYLEEAGKLEPRTLEGYRHALGKITPLVGGIKLSRLTTHDLDHAYARLRRAGGRNGKPLGERSVQAVHRVTSTALRRACKWGMIAQNPAQDAEAPSPGRSAAKAPTPEQLQAYVDAATETEFLPLILTALACGFRRGELLALSWGDIDLPNRNISISRVMCEANGRFWMRPRPKSEAGRREVAIPEALADVLAKHRARQAEEKLAAGESYRRDLDLVFARPLGEPWRPSVLNQKIQPIAKAAGLPRECRMLHGLRHRHASDLLSGGIQLKVASGRLGHSDVTLTANLYQHIDKDLDRQAAEVADRVLRGLLAKKEP
jgi:integrase